MAEYKAQEKDLIFALDIGTRSIVGVVGRPAGGKLKILDIELAEHGKRAMMDGQIDDIKQVAALARTVTGRLEERLGVKLERVSVAAAGRALRTQSGSFSIELSGDAPIDAEQISRLEAGAVSAAEEVLQNDEERRQLFLVGYTVAQYRLDNYPLSNLQYHNGKIAEADVVATFLPGEVVESLYAAMRSAGLQVASLTLEPIAAMNAAIPAELRLLNLALVDIGAGTTDIALCRDGSVVGYTMATVAGDEITESIMRTYLVDFRTAERMKQSLGVEEDIVYRNILGLEEHISAAELGAAIQEPMHRLAGAIAEQISSVNGGPPSALFLAGGGSRLSGLREKVAKSLEMDEKRVAIAGNNYALSVFADGLELERPEYATPLGIAVSAGLGLLNDSYVVLLNGQPAKLFRSGVLTLRDILLMNGYNYADMVGRNGKSMSLTLDGKHLVLRGEPAAPAVLQINEAEAALSAVVHAGDQIHFVPASPGAPAARTLGELLGPNFSGRAAVNNREVPLDTPLAHGDVILTLERSSASPAPPVRPAAAVQTEPVRHVVNPVPVSRAPAQPAPQSPVRPAAQPVQPQPQAVQSAPQPVQPAPPRPAPPKPRVLGLTLNGAPLSLPVKADGSPYYLMDLLQYSGIDFDHLNRPVRLEVNGAEQGFQYELRARDDVTICLE